MLFSESSFLFFFLPAVLFAYFVLPTRFRDGVLLAFSLLFYAWGERRYVLVLCLSITLNWACALAIDGGSADARSRRATVLAVVGNLALLIGFKYANFLVDNLNVALGAFGMSALVLGPVHLPIGISFFAFQGMSYVIDVYRGACPPQRSWLKMAMYKSFFPQLIAGPIVRYVDVKEQIEQRVVTLDDFAEGTRRFIVGLGKKMIIANLVARPTDEIFALPASQLSTPLAWFGVLGYTLQIYFDFSAYSDMAIGLGRMFGFRFLENFNYPYVARSLTDFWRRWHISLSTWFRDYLYIPLGGNRVAPLRRYGNLLLVFLLCGLWHGASWNFALWGLFHGTFLILERLRVLAPLRRAPSWLAHLYVVITVMAGWVLFRAETLSAAGAFYKALLGAAEPLDTSPNLALLADSEVCFGFALALIGATPILPALLRRIDLIKRRGPTQELSCELLQIAALLGVLVYSTLLMAAGSYSPFIYFRF